FCMFKSYPKTVRIGEWREAWMTFQNLDMGHHEPSILKNTLHQRIGRYCSSYFPACLYQKIYMEESCLSFQQSTSSQATMTLQMRDFLWRTRCYSIIPSSIKKEQLGFQTQGRIACSSSVKLLSLWMWCSLQVP